MATSKNDHWHLIVPGIAATYIGTIVGAGFASGQEILQFFSRYGQAGFLGICLTIILLGLAGVKLFQLVKTLEPRSYQDLLLFLLGPRLTVIIDYLLLVFFLILIAVMLAGSGTIFAALQLNYQLGVAFTVIFMVVVLWKDLPGLITTNLIVIPLMFLGSLSIAIYTLNFHCLLPTVNSVNFNWLLAALQFSAYNFVLAIPVLLALGKKYPVTAFLNWGSWLGSLGLGLMAGLINWSICAHFVKLNHSALPMVDLARTAGNFPYYSYALILWGEMFTTLLANTYGVAQRLVVLTDWSFRFWVIIVAIGGLLLSQFGFINLISCFYPCYGFLCLIIMVLLFIKPMIKSQHSRLKVHWEKSTKTNKN